MPTLPSEIDPNGGGGGSETFDSGSEFVDWLQNIDFDLGSNTISVNIFDLGDIELDATFTYNGGFFTGFELTGVGCVFVWNF